MPTTNTNVEHSAEWKNGYYAEKAGEPWDEDESDDWKEGYKASYEWFLKYGKGAVPQKKE